MSEEPKTIEYLLGRFKDFEATNNAAVGKLFIMHSRLENDMRNGEWVHREEIRTLKKQLAELKK